jgi:hypothetical protein
MSEPAIDQGHAEAVTEMPTATTVVEEGGPTSFREAANEFFKNNESPEIGEDASMSKEEVEAFMETRTQTEEAPEVKTEEAAPEAVEEVADDFGFEGDGDEPTETEAFDAEAFDKETEQQIQGLDPKAQDGWKKLRQENKDLKTGATPSTREAELQAKLADAEAKAAKVEAMQERVESMTEKNYILEVQDSPEYKQQIAAPAKEINAVMDTVAGSYEFVSREELEKAIREPDLATRAALIDKIGVVTNEDGDAEQRLPTLVQSEIQRVAMLYGKIQHENEEMMSNAEERFQAIQKQRDADALKASEEDREMVNRHLEDRWEKFRKAIPTEGTDTARKQSMAFDIQGATAANRAYAQMAGFALPEALAEIRSLKAQVAGLGGKARAAKAATPNLSQGTGKAEETAPKGYKSLAEASRALGDL